MKKTVILIASSFIVTGASLFATPLPDGSIVNAFIQYDRNFLMFGDLRSQGDSTLSYSYYGMEYFTFSSNYSSNIANSSIDALNKGFYDPNNWSLTYNGMAVQMDQINLYGPPMLEVYGDIYLDQNQLRGTVLPITTNTLTVAFESYGMPFTNFSAYLRDANYSSFTFLNTQFLDYQSLQVDLSGITLAEGTEYFIDLYYDNETHSQIQGLSGGDLVMEGIIVNRFSGMTSLGFATEMTPVPEPSSYATFSVIASFAMAFTRRKRK